MTEQGDDQPGLRDLPEPSGDLQPFVGFRRSLDFVEIDDRASARKELRERAVERLAAGG